MKMTRCWLAAVLLAAPVLAADSEPGTGAGAGADEDLFQRPASTAQAQAILDAAMPGLGQVQVLRGRFNQRKFLSDIPTPLSSAGEFLMVREQGIWWHTQTPLDAELTLIPGGGARQLAASIMLALFTLDLHTLARHFDLFMIGSGPHWRLGLRARDSSLSAWFEQAILDGGERVEQVTLFEATGDRTEIALDAAPHPRSSLTPAERQRFDR